MKFEPLIKINKQNAVNNKLKLELSKRLSKNISLEEDISNLRMYMLKIIIINWNKNLSFGEIRTFVSEKKPIENIKIKNIFDDYHL